MPVSKEIIKRCVEQSPQAQKIVFEEYAPMVMAICLRYVNEKIIADDLLQETFITVFDKISQFKGNGPFGAWLRKIAVNKCLLYLRNKKNIENFDKEDIYPENSEPADNEQADIDYDSRQYLIENAGFSSDEIFEIIKKLPEGFRTVFNMYAIDGLKHNDIAKQLNISVSTSKSQLMRARAKMLELLHEEAIKKIKKSEQINNE